MAHLEKVIGLPRGLNFYEHYPFLYGFFKSLDIKVVLSDRTTKKTLAGGSALVVSETCLPVKIYVGQVLNLLEKGVKNIFVPSIQSIAPKIYNCSKIRGLPDLIRNVIKQDFNLIEPTLDKSEKNLDLRKFLADTVRPFGIVDKEKIEEAMRAGFVTYNNFKVMMQQGLSYKKALANVKNSVVEIPPAKEVREINVAVIGHAYNLYDTKASMDIFKKLEDYGVGHFSAYNLTEAQLRDGMNNMKSEVYWANELEMTGAAGYFLNSDTIDGIITINAFGCGPDSLMIERMIRHAHEFGKPMLNLTIDEHSGEAGFVTRLEAFCDMLYRKKMKLKTAAVVE